jgi:hypothetical protein
MKNPWKWTTLILATMLVVVVGWGGVQTSNAEKQPLMQSALTHLVKAKKLLNKATHDKGGHRVKAIAHTKKAIKQVKEGIKHDNRN